jgi:nicotinamidase-related amidase
VLTADQIPDGSAILLVDVQRGFVNEHTRALPEAIGRLLDEVGDRFRLRVASRYTNTEGSPCRVFLASESVSERPDTDLCAAVERPDVVVLDKSTYALGEPLGELLSAHGITTLFIAGVDTHACVLHEALDAFDRCVQPIVLADLCGSGNGQEEHAAALRIMRAAIGVQNVWEDGRPGRPES